MYEKYSSCSRISGFLDNPAEVHPATPWGTDLNVGHL